MSLIAATGIDGRPTACLLLEPLRLSLSSRVECHHRTCRHADGHREEETAPSTLEAAWPLGSSKPDSENHRRLKW